MGTWGPGLYANDVALDLRPTITAVCRLPIDAAEIIRLLVDLNPMSGDPGADDHTTFWLVTADLLHKRGIASEATDRALAIIDDGSDLATLTTLGMGAGYLEQRVVVLGELRDRLSTPPPVKRRRTLARPQPLLVSPGEVHVFQIDERGRCYNPYFVKPQDAGFVPAAWRACTVVDTGHALGYLAWYQVARSDRAWTDAPTLAQVLDEGGAGRVGVGTMPKNHMTRMGLRLVGTTTPPPVASPTQDVTVRITVNDISLSNVLSDWRA